MPHSSNLLTHTDVTFSVGMELSLSISGLIFFITSTYKIKLGFNYSAGDSFPDKGIPICLTFDMSSAQQEGTFFRWLAGAMSWITQSIHKRHFLPQHRLGCFVFIFLAHGLIFPLFIGGGRAPSLPPQLFWVFLMLSTFHLSEECHLVEHLASLLQAPFSGKFSQCP